MKSPRQEQWTEHLRDEAVARQVQQAAAGRNHTPLEGPLPYSAADLDLAVAGAVRRERARCAAIADHWGSEAALLAVFSDFTQWELRAAAEAARLIGKAIRGEPGR